MGLNESWCRLVNHDRNSGADCRGSYIQHKIHPAGHAGRDGALTSLVKQGHGEANGHDPENRPLQGRWPMHLKSPQIIKA